MSISRYNNFEDVWDSNLRHTKKGWPKIDLNTYFSFNDNIAYEIPLEYQYRPDLIAMKFYKDPTLFWAIVYANNFYNSPEDFETGVVIQIPRYERVISM
jgi:hypothetical protein